jgi:putative Ca2+/H+ antiporter (TMEM165/GDT1 family)
MILFSEIGDKTFIIAAILAMKHSRFLVFSSSMSALALMTILSAALGSFFPVFLSRHLLEIVVQLLFLGFGLKMIREGLLMTGQETQQELDSVQMEIDNMEKAEEMDRLESGNTISINDSTSYIPKSKFLQFLYRIYKRIYQLFHPVWIEGFVLTFLAEWGDRSQVTTIALAGSEDFWWVSIGSVLGHAVCTGIAVLGGRLLASKISVRVVTLLGGFLFIIFGLLSIFYK